MFNYPLNLAFKIIALNPQVIVKDQTGKVVLYVRQKAFALKEDVKVYSDESMERLIYQIKANKIIDFSAQYNISDENGNFVGSIRRRGMKSIWKATYLILDSNGNEMGMIHEENPWLRLADSFLSEIPFLGMIINPAYLVDLNGLTKFYLQKKPAVFEGKFELGMRGDISEGEEKLLIPACLMMLMIERMRG